MLSAAIVQAVTEIAAERTGLRTANESSRIVTQAASRLTAAASRPNSNPSARGQRQRQPQRHQPEQRRSDRSEGAVKRALPAVRRSERDDMGDQTLDPRGEPDAKQSGDNDQPGLDGDERHVDSRDHALAQLDIIAADAEGRQNVVNRLVHGRQT